MATNLENLRTRRTAVITELAAITSTSAGGKPDSRDGGVAHTAYRLSLYEELDKLNELIAHEESGAFEVLTEYEP